MDLAVASEGWAELVHLCSSIVKGLLFRYLMNGLLLFSFDSHCASLQRGGLI